VKRWLFASIAVVIAALLQSAHMASVTLLPAQPPQQIQNTNVPRIPFESVPEYFKYSAQMNLGEVLGVAVNSKGRVVILNHPGSATSGPLYGNATTQLLEFDEAGKFAREIGHGVYGLGYAHSVRFDKYDNLWVVDKGTHTVMRFNPAGYVTLNLGRRPEGVGEPDYYKGNGLAGGAEQPAPQHVDGMPVRRPISRDSDDNTTSATATSIPRGQVRQLDQVMGFAGLGDRMNESQPINNPTTSGSTARTRSTSPIAATAASGVRS
jgi:hypothetical protein